MKVASIECSLNRCSTFFFLLINNTVHARPQIPTMAHINVEMHQLSDGEARGVFNVGCCFVGGKEYKVQKVRCSPVCGSLSSVYRSWQLLASAVAAKPTIVMQQMMC